MSFKTAVAAGLSLALITASSPTWAETDLIGPLRIRDMTPFNILRLEMLPAQAVTMSRGSWAIESDLSYTNTFVMSDNVKSYLERRGERRPLTQKDVDAILGMREDAYYVDGEFGLLDLTLHYVMSSRSSIYATLPVYSFAGGFLDGAIEGFHKIFGLDNGPRRLAARNRSQAVLSLGGLHTSYLEPPIGSGVGDPVLGMRYLWPLGIGWSVVVDGAAKLAWDGERSSLSTGTSDLGLQASLQGKLERQGIYFSSSFVWTDGRVLGVRLGRRLVPTLTAAYEVGITSRTNAVLQLYASESALRDTSIREIKANKYEASLGLRHVRGRVAYGLAMTENIANFENTPDFGISLTAAWYSSRP